MVQAPTPLSRWTIVALLLLCALGASLRWWNLGLKPAWGDEWSTLVFSLGNGYQGIPLNQAISLETLLSPLQKPEVMQWHQVLERLGQESNHPPLFFLALHGWLRVLAPPHAWVDVTLARAFSVLWGVAAIPLSFGLMQRWTGSRTIALLGASMMTLSPFGVYLAQEARHYTLSLIWLLGLLAYLYQAQRSVRTHHPLPWLHVFLWIGLNSLGLATHFFYGLGLGAAALVLGVDWIKAWGDRTLAPWSSPPWIRLYLVALGTLSTTLVWLPTWHSVPGTSLTTWLERRELWAPAGRLLLWILTTVMLLPVEGVPNAGAIVSAVILVIAFLASLGLLLLGLLRRELDHGDTSRPSPWYTLGGFILAALAIVLGLIYGFNNDLSLAPRYQFFYSPAVILLWSLWIFHGWHQPQRLSKLGAIVLLLLALSGSISVGHNWAYQKSEQSDRFFQNLTALPWPDHLPETIVIATAHHHHGDTGRLMGLAWQWQQARRTTPLPFTPHPQFFLAHGLTHQPPTQPPTQPQDSLLTWITTQTQPYQLWLINFPNAPNLEAQGCITLPNTKAPGYWSHLYHCP